MTGPRNVAANFAQATSVTIATSPSGLGILVDGTSYMAPQTFQWIIGSNHTIEAATPQAGAAGDSLCVCDLVRWRRGLA